MILTINTAQPEAIIKLLQPDGELIHQDIWQPDRTLATTLLAHISEIVDQAGFGLDDITGVIVFRGPGSFTGLRIGCSVANAFAYSQDLPIVGTNGSDWESGGIAMLSDNQNHQLVIPDYGSEPRITRPRK